MPQNSDDSSRKPPGTLNSKIRQKALEGDQSEFADELADLKDRYGTRLQLVHVLSREPQDAPLRALGRR